MTAQGMSREDGFHEIQLNGKQLVFLFMAATVVSVVIFLCGVLVGRGVRAEKGPEPMEVASGEVAPEPAAAAPGSQPPAPPAGDPSQAPPPMPADDLSYYNRLQGGTPPPETLKPAEELRASAPSGAPAETTAAASQAAQAPKSEAALPAEPGGDGFSVQIAALRERGEAEAIVKRLSGKGYPAYVMAPPAGAPSTVYRVRVGKFKNRREAEDVAARLEKEEQFKPWIIR